MNLTKLIKPITLHKQANPQPKIAKSIKPYDFFQEVRQAGYYFVADKTCELDNPNYHIDNSFFWEQDFDVLVFKRKPLESFSQIQARNGLSRIHGMWYGYAALIDAETVFNETKLMSQQADLFFIIKPLG